MQRITADSSSRFIQERAVTTSTLSKLPFEIICRIGLFCSPQAQTSLTLTSRNTSRYFGKRYTEILRFFKKTVPQIDANGTWLSVKEVFENEKQLVSKINNDLIQQIRRTDGGQAFLDDLKQKQVPWAAALKEMDSWLKDINLLIFASAKIPPMWDFMHNLNKSSLSLNQKAEAIRSWMQTNKEKLHSIISLRLVKKNLTSLPPEISLLSSLKMLDISQNQLISLPPKIGRLSTLIWLFVLNNRLTTIPPEIGKLSSLIELAISNNQLSDLPLEIGRLSSLRWLYAQNNKDLPLNLKVLNELRKQGVEVCLGINKENKHHATRLF